MDIVRPKYERSEKQRLSSLDPKEKIKEEGYIYNNSYKNNIIIINYNTYVYI